MKILLAVITLLILLTLDFLVLLDIIKGEPDLTAEYGIIAISAIAAICRLDVAGKNKDLLYLFIASVLFTHFFCYRNFLS